MALILDGDGTISGLNVGGLPDGSVNADDLASNAVTTAKITDANITAAKLDGAQSGSAPIYAARAWVNFDGTTATPSTIRGSGNVSSVTKNGTGNYTVNLTTAVPSANYAVVASSKQTDGTGIQAGDRAIALVNTKTTTSYGIVHSVTQATNAVDVLICDSVLII
jgi:hypothetical protein